MRLHALFHVINITRKHSTCYWGVLGCFKLGLSRQHLTNVSSLYMNIFYMNIKSSQSGLIKRIYLLQKGSFTPSNSWSRSNLFRADTENKARLFFLIRRRIYPRLSTIRASFHLLYRIGNPTFPSFTSIAIAREMGLHWNFKHHNWTHFEQWCDILSISNI